MAKSSRLNNVELIAFDWKQERINIWIINYFPTKVGWTEKLEHLNNTHVLRRNTEIEAMVHRGQRTYKSMLMTIPTKQAGKEDHPDHRTLIF